MKFTAQQAEDTRTRLIEWLENEHKSSQAVLEHMPEDKLGFTPHEKLRPFRDLYHHLYTSAYWFANIIETGKVDFSGEGGEPPAPATKAELAASCAGMHDYAMKVLRSASTETLCREIAFGSMGTYPAVHYMDWHLVHLVHHRGQLTVYLRLAGARVPSIYGGSADFPISM